MNDAYYYVSTSGDPTGPYTLAQLRAMWKNGSLTAVALFWTEKNAEWRPLSKIASILDCSSPTSPPQVPSYPQAPDRSICKELGATPHIVEQLETISDIPGNTPISEVIRQITKQRAWGGVIAAFTLVIIYIWISAGTGNNSEQPSSAPTLPQPKHSLSTSLFEIGITGDIRAMKYVKAMAEHQYDVAAQMILPKDAPIDRGGGFQETFRDMFSDAPYAKNFVAEKHSSSFETSGAAKANGVSAVEFYRVGFIYKPEGGAKWEDMTYLVIVVNYNGKWYVENCRDGR